MDYNCIEDYEAIKTNYIGLFENEYSNNIFFAMCQALQNFYCNHSDRTECIQTIVDEKPNEQFIIFVKFLASIPSNAHSITGECDIKERIRTLEEFKQGKFKVLYLTYGIGAYGLNLQFCHNVIFAEHTFDYAMRIQAEARVYRMGQTSNVDYYNLWCDTGLEKIIRSSQNKKTGLLDDVKKEIQKHKEDKKWQQFIKSL